MSDTNLRQQVILNAVDKLTRPFHSVAASVKMLAAAVQNSRLRLKEINAQIRRFDGFFRAGVQSVFFNQSLNSSREEAAKPGVRSVRAGLFAEQPQVQWHQKERGINPLQNPYRALRQSLKGLNIVLALCSRSLGQAQRALKLSFHDARQGPDRQWASLPGLREVTAGSETRSGMVSTARARSEGASGGLASLTNARAAQTNGLMPNSPARRVANGYLNVGAGIQPPAMQNDGAGAEREQRRSASQQAGQEVRVSIHRIVEMIDVQLKGVRPAGVTPGSVSRAAGGAVNVKDNPPGPVLMPDSALPAGLPGKDIREQVAALTDALKSGAGSVQQWANACREMAGPLRCVALILPEASGGVSHLTVTASAAFRPLAMLSSGISRLAEQANEAFRQLAGEGAAKAAEAIERLKKAFNGQQEAQKGGGILDALRDGALEAITGQAQKAMSLLILAFTRPAEAIRELNALLAGLRTSVSVIGAVISVLGSGIGSLFASLTGSISSAGGMIAWLASGPFAMLRMVWTGLSALMLALLTPVGGVIAALAAVGMVIWKFWQPIGAFIGGVVAGFAAAAAPITALFAPLKPMFQSIGSSLNGLRDWFIQILTPVKSTAEALDNAAAMGSEFGQVLAAAFNGLLKPLLIVHDSLDWLLDKLGLVGEKTQEIKLPADAAKKSSAFTRADNYPLPDTAGWWYPGAPFPVYDSGGSILRGQFGIVGERGPEIVSGPAHVTSRRRTAALASLVAVSMGAAAAPVELAPLHPLSLAAERAVSPTPQAVTAADVHIETHAPITIYAQPGQDARDIAREVARQLDERERLALARARSSYSDRGGYES
ncbi:hypothetical protein [Erwinia sp. SLM-02]|uniref:hypothetical protein n=1 Tax=Erwinia sp. SLM-02 TaxID=3020057 RepID=UPI003080D0C3